MWLCSKIPDIYDCIKFDCIHNWSQLFAELDGMRGVAACAVPTMVYPCE